MPPLVLLVEDDPGDVLLVRRAFQKADLEAVLEVVEDGEAALARLRDPSRPWPRVVLLDLNLPRKSGLEVLGEIKTDPELRVLPVTVLTSSRAAEDLRQAYTLGVNSYLVKPVALQELVEIVQAVDVYWLHLNVTPKS
ncbi:Response regulator rcp1 [Calidithermus terrae]|uniref:Response regulator rcp1 n=1 Tax=Calidithermus terrae TaxID=1408545 RepID=A0A399E0H3_9DEIN|nr:response regulator [Calidithermus terrae]RIH75970.1 Response regulator rcp1 [Calidithermus terrae]